MMSDKVDYIKKLQELEAPGRMLSDIPIEFNSASLPVGFNTFEECEYFRSGQPDLMIIAARPACGKSALLCQMAYNLSEYENVHLFSLEMDKRQIKTRLMSLVSNLSFRDMRGLNKDRLADYSDQLINRKLYIDDTNGLNVNQLFSRAIERNKTHPVGAIFVDYLQIVASPNPGRSKAEEVDLVCRRLKELALELKCPVIAAAQMSRNIEGRCSSAKKKEEVTPIMSDLADSAGIEKWSDVIIFLHRQYVNGVQSPHDIGAYVAKNRHGQGKDVKLYFEGPLLKFYDRGYLTGGGI
jgi:replicative DNA helicase